MGDERKWLHQPQTKKVLLSFASPATPRQVEKQLGIKKLKLTPFLKKGLIISLNPTARKGRLYILTDKARQLLFLPEYNTETKTRWNAVGFVLASPRQRHVLLKTMGRDSIKRTSEHIRKRAANLNPRLSRISTKEILKELISQRLVETEIGDDHRRYYWINKKGRAVIQTIGLNNLDTCFSYHSS